MKFPLAISRFIAIACCASVAASVAHSAQNPNPADSAAVGLPVKYESPFPEYQPLREEKVRSWKEVNKEVAENPGMASMGSMKSMPGMDSSAGGGAGHDMASMKAKRDADSKSGTAPRGKHGAADHNMDSMKDMRGKAAPSADRRAGKSMNMDGHDTMAMAMAKPQAGSVQASGVTGSGIVRGIDKANARVKLTHDPIATLGWPTMTMFFRLKDRALANPVKEGDKVEFSLEKSASGYVISSLRLKP